MTEVQALRIMFNRYREILRGIPCAVAKDRTSVGNLLWMCDTALTEDMEVGKMNRWLGFIQGVLAARQLIDVDTEREHSRPLFHKAKGHQPTLERQQ